VPDIKVFYNNDGYGYEYCIIGSDHKVRHIRKSGFKTLKEAQEAARISYARRSKEFHAVDTIPSIKTRIKNFDYSSKMWEIITVATLGGFGLVCVIGGAKLVKDFKDKFIDVPAYVNSDEGEIPIVIKTEDCDYSNLHVIIRSAKKETYATAEVISDELNSLGLSNEIISHDGNYIDRINNTLNAHPDSNILFINIESGVESDDKTIIMNDTSNKKEYPSDVLASCINASCIEYNFDTRLLSGVPTGNGWRLETSIEKNLLNNGLNNRICQLTVSFPTNIDNETIRNNAASSVVEGLMRYCYLPKEERYKDIYHCAKYGDTIQLVADYYNVSSDFVYNHSTLNPYKLLTVGDTLVVGDIPESAASNYGVYNPLTTADINNLELIYEPYVVKEGDTLTRIANTYGVKVEQIKVESGNPNNIRVGETIFIPKYNLYLTSPKNSIINQDDILKNTR